MRFFSSSALTAVCLASCLFLSACDEDDAGGAAPPVVTHDGDYEGVDNMVLNLEVVSTTGGAPATGDCLGDMQVTVDLAASPQITGTGSCLLPANAASYTLEGDFDDENTASGTFHILFNGQNHDVAWSGTFDAGEMTGTAVGTTAATATININWDGAFDAARP